MYMSIQSSPNLFFSTRVFVVIFLNFLIWLLELNNYFKYFIHVGSINTVCCRIECNCPLVWPGTMGGMPSVGVFPRDPSSYLRYIKNVLMKNFFISAKHCEVKCNSRQNLFLNWSDILLYNKANFKIFLLQIWAFLERSFLIFFIKVQ